MISLLLEAQIATSRSSVAVDNLNMDWHSMVRISHSVKISCLAEEPQSRFLGKFAVANQKEFPQRQGLNTKRPFFPVIESFRVSKQSGTARLGDIDLKVAAPCSLSATKEVILPRSKHFEPATNTFLDCERVLEVRICKDEMERHKVKDPVPPVTADDSHSMKAKDNGHQFVTRRNSKDNSPSLSLSQGFCRHGSYTILSTIGAVGSPVARTGRIRGPIGTFMVFVVTVFAISSTVMKTFFATADMYQKVCAKCDGYGLVLCDICGGCGHIQWEGKLMRIDPCPLCFGACTKKCSTCGGVCRKRGKSSTVVWLPHHSLGKK